MWSRIRKSLWLVSDIDRIENDIRIIRLSTVSTEAVIMIMHGYFVISIETQYSFERDAISLWCFSISSFLISEVQGASEVLPVFEGVLGFVGLAC